MNEESLYARSQSAIARAEFEERRGDDEAARAAYAEAAQLQREWVASMGEHSPKTRSVFAASAVAAYYKAGQFGPMVEYATEEALGQPWLLDESRQKVEETIHAAKLLNERWMCVLRAKSDEDAVRWVTEWVDAMLAIGQHREVRWLLRQMSTARLPIVVLLAGLTATLPWRGAGKARLALYRAVDLLAADRPDLLAGLAHDEAPPPIDSDTMEPLRVGFDVGGVLSAYPDIAGRLFWALMDAPGVEVHVLTDMSRDKAAAMLALNGISLPPGRLHCCDYAAHGDACKSVVAAEVGLHVLVDDHFGYVTVGNAPPMRLFVVPNPDRDYYHPTWKTDGAEGDFGRRLQRREVAS